MGIREAVDMSVNRRDEYKQWRPEDVRARCMHVPEHCYCVESLIETRHSTAQIQREDLE